MTKLIKMRRDEPVHSGGPTEMDVHPDEAPGLMAHGWQPVGDVDPDHNADASKKVETPEAEKPAKSTSKRKGNAATR